MTRLALAAASIMLGLGGDRSAPAADEAFFLERVAPVLERRCVSCHGAKTSKGGLALHEGSALLRGGEAGPALDPEAPDASLLLEKISGDAPEMPKTGGPLAREEVEAIRRWISEGAVWPAGRVLADRHLEDRSWWSLRPLADPVPPRVVDSGWVRTPIDAFILAELERSGMKPSPEADRRTLIRRLTFDLIGLPPTPEEIAAFEADPRADAYERLVERLLASPAHGERWARHWLDVAHYGDTHGYDKDKRRDNAWPYRDYVIESLNRDKPYAEFLMEQVAGDVLAPGRAESVIATGFLAAGPWDFVGHVELREGTVDKEKTRLLDRDDMLSNVVTTFNSLTIGCARCHDHKFDPIPQRDYYRLQAVFAGVERGDRVYDDGAADPKRVRMIESRDAIARELERLDAELAKSTAPELATLDRRIADAREALARLPRSSRALDAAGPTNGFHSAIFDRPESTSWVQIDLGSRRPIDEIRIIPARPVDFRDTPGFGWPREFRVEASDDVEFRSGVVELCRRSTADDSTIADEPLVLRPNRVSGRYLRITATRLWKRTDDYVFALSEVEVESGGENVARSRSVTASSSIEAGRWSKAHLVDGADSRNRRPPDGSADAERRSDLLYSLDELLAERDRRYREIVGTARLGKRAELTAELAAVDREIARLPKGRSVYAARSISPRPIHLLMRGDVEQPRELVGPGMLSCLPELDSEFTGIEDEGRRRLELARRLASPENPLTWRSIVNRVWQYHVGRGIVDTPSDFGRNGSTPTHPELLDWLARRFRDGGGSLRSLHRLIVVSSFYRQASSENSAYAAIDSENRRLWRMNRRRLEAEAIRDAVLFAAGTLDLRRGGPGYEPFRFVDDHSPVYDHASIEHVLDSRNRRRSIYRFVVRSVPHPFLECLDAADPNQAIPTRSTTVTPLQALALWNDPFMLQRAREFAARVDSGGTVESRVGRAFEIALGRAPSVEEAAILGAVAREHGMVGVCRVLLNSNEFAFID
ncbi:MAG: DUF1549 domain-containing protein [Isosphaeraceae bacterium]|nr:DUF1549 domain-containing protein [Isosphaeraceae bacterium]